MEKVAHDLFKHVLKQDPDHGEKINVLHFSYLAAQMRLSDEDLSLYVLAYLFECTHTACYLDMTEMQFVNGVVKVLQSLPRTDAALSGNVEACFKALRNAVINKNGEIRENTTELEKFYNFLHVWAVKGAADPVARRESACELWQFFFTKDTPATGSEKFVAYAQFPNIEKWTEFISSPVFARQNLAISKDLWSQLLPFTSVKSYDTHDDQGPSPIAIDNFVEWYKLTAKKA